MNEKKRKVLVYATLVAAIIFALIMRPWERQKPKPPETMTIAARAVPLEQTPVSASLSDPMPQIAANVLTSVSSITSWPRDPFHLPAESPTQSGSTPTKASALQTEWNLQGVLTVDKQQVCLINGRTYKSGAVIDGWEITYIGTDGVRLRRGVQTKSLALPTAGM